MELCPRVLLGFVATAVCVHQYLAALYFSSVIRALNACARFPLQYYSFNATAFLASGSVYFSHASLEVERRLLDDACGSGNSGEEVG